MATEIERKFLIDPTPGWLERCESERIDQGYLVVVEGEREVRLRRKGDRLSLGVKLGRGRSRDEQEIELSSEQFDALWPLTEGARVRKRRYEIAHGKLTIELDRYEGELDGLAVAEVEFGSEQRSDGFEPPEWFGPELTGDSRWANQSLALHGRPETRS